VKVLLTVLILFNIHTANAVMKVEGIDLRLDKKVKLELGHKKPVVYYFLSARCPCSQGSFDHLNSLQKKHPDFEFVGFHSSVDIPKSEALIYFKKYEINFPIILDDKVIYADKLKALKTPHVFIIGTDNEILFQGGATNSRNPKNASKFYLQDALAALNSGKVPVVQNAKTIGCYISREL
jgi:hypothetical protein